MLQNDFYNEQSALLQNFLTTVIFPTISNDKQGHYGVELILTPDCNKNCSYCYLQKHKDLLYPIETRDLNTIKKNYKLVLDYFLQNQVILTTLDFFTGEIWGTPFSFEVFDILLEYIQKGLKVLKIVIPTNGSFTQNPSMLKVIEDYIQTFADLNIQLLFSLSYDGILDNENRPYNDLSLPTYDDQKIFDFADKYNYGYHPMVSAYNIDKWVENHQYFKQKIQEQGRSLTKSTMFLEVRDGNTWNEQTIEKYLQWLQVFTKDSIAEEFGTDYVLAIESILRLNCQGNYSYMPYFLGGNNEPSCSLTQRFTIRLGDLAIVPCHRTCYDKLIYGKFLVENDKIIGVQGNNPGFMFSNFFMGGNGTLKCDTCIFARYCIKQCRGACFEHHREALYPIEDVCNLEITKIIFSMNVILSLREKVKNETLLSPLVIKNLSHIEKTLQTIHNQEEYSTWIQLAEKYPIKF